MAKIGLCESCGNCVEDRERHPACLQCKCGEPETSTFKNPTELRKWSQDTSCEGSLYPDNEWDMEVTFTRKSKPKAKFVPGYYRAKGLGYDKAAAIWMNLEPREGSSFVRVNVTEEDTG